MQVQHNSQEGAKWGRGDMRTVNKMVSQHQGQLLYHHDSQGSKTFVSNHPGGVTLSQLNPDVCVEK